MTSWCIVVCEFSFNPRQWSDYICPIKLTRPSQELGEQGNGHLFQVNNTLILRKIWNKDNIGNRENKNTNFRGTEELDNLYQGNKGTGTFLGASLLHGRYDGHHPPFTLNSLPTSVVC